VNHLLSVVVPTYNRAEELIRCICSIPTEISDFIEIIVIDDASNDGTDKAIGKLQSTRDNIAYYLLNHNQGVSYCRNYGINRAHGKFITFIDSDDEFIAEELRNIINYLSSIEVNLVIADFETRPFISEIEAYGLFTAGISFFDNKLQLMRDYLKNPRGNGLLTYCWGKIYDRNFLIKNKIFFNENVKIYEDMDFLSKVLIASESIYIYPKKIYRYHVSPNGLSGNVESGNKLFIEVLHRYGSFVQDEKLASLGINLFIIKLLIAALKNKNSKLFDELAINYKEEIENFPPKLIKFKPLKFMVKFGFMKNNLIRNISCKIVSNAIKF